MIYKRLFVDIDDTLVLWRQDSISWVPNIPLIQRITDFEGEIFIWSWGGKEYAQEFANQILKNCCFQVLEKPISYFPFQETDIIVDDMPEVFALYGITQHKIHSPFEILE